MSAARFHLFHPHASVSGTTLTCAVDVVPADDLLLGRGDSDLVVDFATSLGLDLAEVTRWSLTPFNTPYYAHDIDSDVFEQSMSPAWRLRFAAAVPAGGLTQSHTTEVLTLHGESRTVGMVRVSLGAIRLPERFDDVWDVVEACYRQAFVMHHVPAYSLCLDIVD